MREIHDLSFDIDLARDIVEIASIIEIQIAHAQTSVIATRASVLACRNAGGLGRPRLRCG